MPLCSPKYMVFCSASFSFCSLSAASRSSISLRFAAFASSASSPQSPGAAAGGLAALRHITRAETRLEAAQAA